MTQTPETPLPTPSERDPAEPVPVDGTPESIPTPDGYEPPNGADDTAEADAEPESGDSAEGDDGS